MNIFILFQIEVFEIKTHVFKRKQVISMAAKASLFFAEGKVSAGENFKMHTSDSLLIMSNI